MIKCFRLSQRVFIITCFALSSTACAHVVQEAVVKSRFNKKYDCSFKDVEIIEESVFSDTRQLTLRGCGFTATYVDGEEIVLE
jgi:hypothetical protein